MIKFFRHIRQRMIKENRFSKYLLYAIGEIVLVVIGILIALQINNWNTLENTARTEIEILKMMNKNLNADLRDMKGNLRFYKTRRNAAEEVLSSLSNPEYDNDSISFFYANLGLHPYFIETTSAYENLKSIGFEIIKNDSLKENIMFVYDKRYQWIENLESGHSDFHDTKLAPLLIENLISGQIATSATPVDLAKLKSNHQFIETIKYSYGWNNYMVARYQEIMIDVIALEQQIADEIAQRE